MSSRSCQTTEDRNTNEMLDRESQKNAKAKDNNKIKIENTINAEKSGKNIIQPAKQQGQMVASLVSNYQTFNIIDLPSAYTWPSMSTTPNQESMHYDLTGLHIPHARNPQQRSEINEVDRYLYRSYDATRYKLRDSSYGLGGLERYLAKDQDTKSWTCVVD